MFFLTQLAIQTALVDIMQHLQEHALLAQLATVKLVVVLDAILVSLDIMQFMYQGNLLALQLALLELTLTLQLICVLVVQAIVISALVQQLV